MEYRYFEQKSLFMAELRLSSGENFEYRIILIQPNNVNSTLNFESAIPPARTDEKQFSLENSPRELSFWSVEHRTYLEMAISIVGLF